MNISQGYSLTGSLSNPFVEDIGGLTFVDSANNVNV